MRLVKITVPFEFTEEIERILDETGIADYVRTGMTPGRDCTGKHTGTQVHPGSLTLLDAQVPDDDVDNLLDALEEFRAARETHNPLTAVVLAVERRIGQEPESTD
jgi:hypothetical protein